MFHWRPFGSRIVRGLDAYDQALVAQRHLCGRLRFHVGQAILELRATHALADNVEECKHACLRTVDHALPEVFKIAPSGTARVGNRRHANSESKAIRILAIVPGVRTWLTRPGVDMHVYVHQTWHDVKPTS